MNLEDKKKIAICVGNALGNLTVIFLAPFLLMIGLNKVFYEFNCPTFDYWTYWLIYYGIRTLFASAKSVTNKE